MFRIFAIIALTIGLGLPAKAEDAAKQVITDQIAAFQQDDVTTAFGFASPNIKSIFGSADQFGLMVRNAYPMVWRPSDVQFLDTREVDGGLLQDVLIRDARGVFHELEYFLVSGPEGWKINGVRFKPQAEGTA